MLIFYLDTLLSCYLVIIFIILLLPCNIFCYLVNFFLVIVLSCYEFINRNANP